MIYFVGYIATIFAANWAISTVGFVPVGFGLSAPAGVAFAGLALGLRDLVQEQLGRRWTITAVLIGAGASALIAPTFAIASGAAFLFSELADFAVYTPLRARSFYVAVLASNAVGLVIDSALFLWLAFGSLAFLAGQIVGKTEITLGFVVLAWIWRSGALPLRRSS